MTNEEKEILIKALTDQTLFRERIKKNLLNRIEQLKIHGEAAKYGESETPPILQFLSLLDEDIKAIGASTLALLLIETLAEIVYEDNLYILNILGIDKKRS